MVAAATHLAQNFRVRVETSRRFPIARIRKPGQIDRVLLLG
jgi:hypothetical protein